ncbi:MAG: hypothetical protein ACK4TF_08040 [Thermodesulfovibrionales bacterium]
MKINFTKKQFQSLIKLIHLGNWMANVHRIDETIEEFNELEQYILSFGKDFGMEDHIEYDEGLKQFFLTQEYIENSGLEDLIDSYNDEIFWVELVTRLSERDVIEKYGIKEAKNMGPEELISKKLPFWEIYEKEFEENGLQNLRIIKGPKIIL